MSNKYSTTEPSQAVEIRMGTEGAAALPPRTVIQVFQDTVQRYGNRPAMFFKKKVDGVLPREWQITNWQQYYNLCLSFAKTLVHLNFGMYDIINVIGFNSPEWMIANNGAILAGGIAAGIYTTNTSDAAMYIVTHSKARVLIVEDNKQLRKFINRTKEAPNLVAVVMYAEAVDSSIATKENFNVPVYNWAEFINLGVNVPDSQLESRWQQILPGNCASLIYTSGTTGPPKAVMISHDNITWTAKVLIDNYLPASQHDRIVSYLPLSHIAAQMIDVHAPMYLGASVYFAQPDALKGSLTTTMKEALPTIFFGVPRVWEKIQEKMVQVGRESTGMKKMLGDWAKAIGAEHSRLNQFGNGGGQPWGYGCINSLVLHKIKEALGLNEAHSCFSAAAPISVDTINYFASLDIPIYEVFGQSECTGPQTISCRHQWKVGYCGRPMFGTQTRIDPENQELLYTGRHIFMGYMYMPSDTAKTIDADGYLHSGDVSEFDDNDQQEVPKPSGFMKITGRIKDLIITAGGENIPPSLIEAEMKSAMVAVSNVMVVGDRQKFLAMLVSLKVDADENGEPTDNLAKDSLFIGNRIGSTATTYTQAMSDPLWKKYVDDGMKTANSKTTSNAQIIQKWKWLPKDLSEKAGDLTPTLKVKRNVVCAKYGELILSLYAGSEE